MTYKERAQDIYNMLGQGQLLDAFDKYYAENIVMKEPRGNKEGKANCRAAEVAFLDSIQEFHGMEVRNLGSDEESATTFIESTMDVTFKNGYRANMHQVSVQKWEGDQIVHEQFFYDNSQS